ncbi:hypothetical protein PTTG_10003 [Puccinia triticina 1-1 BBBD Race 1]|uniref:CCHC-type domain-containing protein n=1 Tax=Puccinia triticina (isolate 1-1 / race 1 (BBBD)) TaxID=630390 RepID=A0A180G9A0_PUCT1|nr:hypothetical protein PTTG_10003 [Puccinia triticina 1-1 BBBD Race 1]
MITTADRRFKPLKFEVLKKAINGVMQRQTALIFEDSKATKPAPSSTIQEANEVMKKMGTDRRTKDVPQADKPVPTMDDLTRMFEAFKQKLDQKLVAVSSKSQGPRGPMVCFYCHREGHGTARCFELQKDINANLVEHRGTNLFFSNGAMIPWDSSRPIQHVVASFQPGKPSTGQAATEPTPGFKAGCGSLQPWCPPATSSQSFAGVYEADPVGRKRHKDPKPYKAPLAPSSAAKRSARHQLVVPVPEEASVMDEEPVLFERGAEDSDTQETPKDLSPKRAPTQKTTGPKQKA